MGWFILSYLFSTLISLVSIGRLSEQEKDLEILLLRYQLSILERKLDKPVKSNRAEKLTLAVKQIVRQWTKPNNHTLVLNTVLYLTCPKSELVLEKHVVAPTANRTPATNQAPETRLARSVSHRPAVQQVAHVEASNDHRAARHRAALAL